jgi:hypothetical protein
VSRVVEVQLAGPYEVSAVTATAASAVFALCTPAESHAVESAFPWWTHDLFYGGLVAGALVVLAGWLLSHRAIRDRGNVEIGVALRIERAGLWISGPLSAAYTIALISGSGLGGVLVIGLGVGITGGHVLRLWRIGRDLRALAALGPPGKGGST